MIFERGQFGDGLAFTQGESGYGLYAMVPSPEMRRYYTQAGEKLFRIIMKPSASIVDLTESWTMSALLEYARLWVKKQKEEMAYYRPPRINAGNVQRFGSIIESFVRERHGLVDAYIVPHKGPGIPTGKQVVIKNLDAIETFEEARP